MSFNLRQIEVFRAVMITGSIRGASQLLFVSQPAVSRLVSHTEARVGFPLFERIRGRLFATPAAKKLFHEVEVVYAGVKRVNELARELSQHHQRILNLITPSTPPPPRRPPPGVPALLPFPLISYDRDSPFGAMVGALFEASGETVRAAIEA